MIFNVPIHLTFNGLYFDLLNCLADSDFHHCPSHQIMNSEAAYPSVGLEDAASHLHSEIKFPSPFNSQSTTSSSAMWKATNQLNLPRIYECPWIALNNGFAKKSDHAGFSTKARKSGHGTFGVHDTFPLCPVCDSSRLPHVFSLGPLPYSLCNIPCHFIQIQEENHTQVSEEPHVA